MFAPQIRFKIEGTNDDGSPYDFNKDLRGEATLEEALKAFKRTFIKLAQDVLIEEQGKGFDTKPTIIVDNSLNKKIEDVKFFGQIEFVPARSSQLVLTPIYDAIEARSRVDTGLYKESNFVFFNGKQVATNRMGFAAWLNTNPQFKEGDKIRFVNVMPYASKLERQGISEGRSKLRLGRSKNKRLKKLKLKIRMPNGAYFLAFRSVDRLLKGNANVKFEWLNGGSLDFSGARTTSKSGKPLRRTFAPGSGRKGSYVYPSIVVRIRGSGVI